MSLEFSKLSQPTGNMKCYDAIKRVMDELEIAQPRTKLPGIWPVHGDAGTRVFDENNEFSLGAQSDSLYEYLIKEYLLLGGALVQPKNMHENFI